ncbi:hypothetical protein [Sodalis sp. dw_96]|uniref:hypothetical protein n=1 Tax=Sodalis sp. dw_96 TaxID=2719794 RepID=UPI001BD68F4B|nr:hypothetical protein [Sodalis sp. dw_96]
MKIVGISKARSIFGQGAGNKALQLSEFPSGDWVRALNSVHASTHSTAKRSFHVSNNFILVACPDDEIQLQIEIFNELCIRADEKLEIQIAEEKERKKQQIEEIERKDKLADEIIKNLKF